MVQGHHSRMDPRIHLIAKIPGNGEELETKAEFTGKTDVLRRQTIYALAINTVKGHRRTEGNGDEDSKLVGCIGAVHVQGGRILRITPFDRLFDSLAIRKPFFCHAGQDVVGRAV